MRSQFDSDNHRYNGKVVYRGLVRIEDIESCWPLPSYAVNWIGRDKHIIAFPISKNKLLNIVAFVSVDESELGGLKESWVAEGDKEEAVEAFKDFEPNARKVVDLMPERPSKWVVNDRDPLEQWIYMDGKVALLGDAAHAMSPHQGEINLTIFDIKVYSANLVIRSGSRTGN